jgi:hypothetical protein
VNLKASYFKDSGFHDVESAAAAEQWRIIINLLRYRFSKTLDPRFFLEA